jgi:hypothetical protein
MKLNLSVAEKLVVGSPLPARMETLSIQALKNLKTKFFVFFLNPASSKPLAVLRLGLASVLIAQAWMLRKNLGDFFSSDGVVQGNLAQFFSSQFTPNLRWISANLQAFHISEPSCISFFSGLYFVSLFFFGLGLFFRVTSVSTWFLHWTLTNTGETTSYGVDLYAHVFLFYLIWMPAASSLSLDSLLFPRAEKMTSSARLSLRVLQLHLCISYFCSGLEKAQGSQWWNGELLWRALNLPVYRQLDMTWLVHWPFLLKVGGWMTLLFELGYCVFIWPKRTRKIWVLGIISLHLGIAVFLGLHLFGVIMAMFTLALFGVSADGSQTKAVNHTF